MEGNGAGFGNLEIVVNGGRVTCHVSRIEQQEKFSANFIPHEAGRHRLDVTFNGDKVPHSPWFCEVRIRKKTCGRKKNLLCSKKEPFLASNYPFLNTFVKMYYIVLNLKSPFQGTNVGQNCSL